jgi:hypothetical protein
LKVADLFARVANQMRLDFEQARSAMSHPLFKGIAFEETYRRFLRSYLPRSLDISTGFLVDSNGNISNQLDVIISDSGKTPILYSNGDTRIIPVECAYAVIEIKARIETSTLREVLENMKSVRNLRKTAYVKVEGPILQYDKLYGKQWEIWPINYYLFAYDSIGMKTLGNNLQLIHQEENLPEERRIDMVCVLDKGVICNKLKNGEYNALPEPESRLLLCETDQSLLLFYTLMSRYINQVRLPAFNFTAYLGEMIFEKPTSSTDPSIKLWNAVSSAGIVIEANQEHDSWIWKTPNGQSGEVRGSKEDALQDALATLTGIKLSE